MRASRAKRIDSNQPDIVNGLRERGISVIVINGAIDIIAGGWVKVWAGDSLWSESRRNFLIEIKDGAKSLSKRRLTKDESKLHKMWMGEPIVTINSLVEGLALFGLKPYNRIKCLNCKDIIESVNRHDYVTCKCGKVSVDGGSDYFKRTGNVGSWKEMP